ncbi:MAG: hypothetical protein FJ004_03810 [Chloroflexi bacterium]|nr:hypothetical protein [Chloroflexota bacterium]
MKYLQAQTVARQIEIVIAKPANTQIGLEEPDLKPFHSWQIVEVDTVSSIAQGFTAGIRKARAPIVALTEDHSYPDEKWAELFIAAHRQPYAVVGPCMINGNPDSMLSWADFYQAYGEWTPPVSSGPIRHLPGHNSSYKRDILLEFGDELGTLMEAESVMHRHLQAKGYELYLESGTRTSHLNFDTWSAWIPARYYTGRQFAATWAHSWPWPRRLLFTAASPLIPWVRLWRVQRRVCGRQPFSFSMRLFPVMLSGLLVEGVGHMLGYAAGVGDSAEKVGKCEFHRIRK